MKNEVFKPRYIVNGDMSQTDVTGDWIDIKRIDNISFQCKWTGTPTGNLIVETSHDGKDNGGAGGQSIVDGGTTSKIHLTGNLGAITLVPSTAGTDPAGGASSTIIRCNQVEAPYIRLRYHKGSSSGTLQVGAAGKGI